jgi:hypothetical protein
MRKYSPFLLILCCLLQINVSGQVKNEYLYNTTMPYGVLDIRTNISATNYFYLQEDETFSFRESAPGVRTNTYHDMTPWDSSPYLQGNLRRKNESKDEFVMNYRVLLPSNYDESFAQGYPMIVLLHGAKERGNCYYQDCFHSNFDYDPNVNTPPAPTAVDHALLNNDYHLLVGGKEHLTARNAAAGKLPNDASLPTKSFPGFVLMPQMMNIWDSLNVQDVIRIIQLHCKQYNIDEDRVYVEGLSIGGYGVYEVLKRAPWLIAAAIPMSAVTEAANIFKHDQQSKVRHIPIWAFQGGVDQNPTPAFTEGVLRKFKNAGALPKYTVFPEAGHVVWGKTFAEPTLFQWLLSHSKTNIHLAHAITEIDEVKKIFPVLELAEGFLAYQWKKDGVVITTATSNKFTPTEAGVYTARFSRVSASPSENQWNELSSPVTITKVATGGEDGDGDDSGEDDGGSGEDGEEDGGEGDGEEGGDGTGEDGSGEGEGDGSEGDGEDTGGDDGGEDDDGDGEDNSGADGGDGEEDPQLPQDTVEVVTGVTEKAVTNISVYPNPVTKNGLSIEFKQHPGEEVIIVIYDAVGRPVYEQVIALNENPDLKIYPNLEAGIYMLIIKTEKVFDQRRLLIKK